MAEFNDRNTNHTSERELGGAPRRINIHDVQALRHWTKKLGISSDQLVSAVRAVGHDSDKVEDYLRRRAS